MSQPRLLTVDSADPKEATFYEATIDLLDNPMRLAELGKDLTPIRICPP